jgi:acetaldehyde dehydrogenase (acetylating)
MANTHELIQTITVGSGGASSIDFTSIPSTYTDLKLLISARCTADNAWAKITFNSSSSGFSSKEIFTATTSYSRSDNENIVILNNSPYTASTFSSVELYIPSYRSSNNKVFTVLQVQVNNSATSSYDSIKGGTWANTAAITAIGFTPYTGNFAQYTTASLYGIKNS